ncbi:MAG: adenylate/guanylate cyclase domain-containing protein [Paracoccaceae bacterium]
MGRPAIRRRRFAGAVAALSLLLAVLIWAQGPLVVAAQEAVFDAVVQRVARPALPVRPVMVVDIGAVNEAGAVWDRGDSARLVAQLAAAKPAVLAFDLVFAGNCEAGAVNDALARALAQSPAVLGFLALGSESAMPEPEPQLAVSGAAGRFLSAMPGVDGPCPALAQRAVAVASVSLIGEGDAVVRKVPAVMAVGQAAYPGLALEAVRVAQTYGPPLLGAESGAAAPWLRLGDRVLPLDGSAQLRFVPSRADVWAGRTLAATDVLTAAPDPRLQGAIVFIGSSLPQRGGLRPTSASPLQPSVQIHADVATGLLTGFLPYRPAFGATTEAGFVLLMGGAALMLLRRFAPVAAMIGDLALAVIWALTALAVYRWTGALIDPAGPALASVLTALIALLGQAAGSARAERTLRAKIGQLLPGAIVARIADNPELLRLEGESRVVTALFTDIEGFSATMRSLGPKDLVAMLDGYFTLTCSIVLRHGGMIDKMVGDSVHALFNAPLDQPGHVDAAIGCAAEIIAATEAFRQHPDRARAGFGRTRIGIETGEAVLGDVGSAGKIDYTAHGDAVNLAARLQEANKALGTSVCIGPAAAALATTPLRPLGAVEIRSFGMLALFSLPVAAD